MVVCLCHISGYEEILICLVKLGGVLNGFLLALPFVLNAQFGHAQALPPSAEMLCTGKNDAAPV